MSNLLQTQLPLFPEAQARLTGFMETAGGLDELARITKADHLFSDWLELGFPAQLLPYHQARHDYWYLVQVLALGRHLNADGTVQAFSLNSPGEFWHEPNLDDLFLFQKMVELGSELPEKISLADLDSLLATAGPRVVNKLGFDPQHYHLRLLKFDELLRLALSLNWQASATYIPVAGYRLHPHGKKYRFIAGHQDFGGFSFIDSWWSNVPLASLTPKLVISKYE